MEPQTTFIDKLILIFKIILLFFIYGFGFMAALTALLLLPAFFLNLVKLFETGINYAAPSLNELQLLALKLATFGIAIIIVYFKFPNLRRNLETLKNLKNRVAKNDFFYNKKKVRLNLAVIFLCMAIGGYIGVMLGIQLGAYFLENFA